eukprot:10027086-Ditylum_brightwellii.AAC.1
MIDWPALERARSNLSFTQRKWSTKWAAEKIPTGTVMEDCQAWTNAACPQKCGEEMEDPKHLITCRKANPLWRKLQSILLSWGAKNAAAPGLMASIVHSLHSWRDDETICPPQGISST